MNEAKTGMISSRVTPELEERFKELFETSDQRTKADFIESLLKNYSPPQESLPIQKTEEIIEPGSKDIKDPVIATIDDSKEEIEVEPVKGTSINIKLNSAQMFVLQETILNPEFISNTNDIVDRVNNGIDKSFWGDDLFSGSFAGIFKEMNPELEIEEAVETNIAAGLVNLFMMQFLRGAGDYIESPVSKTGLKEFMLEQKDEEQKKN